MVISGELENVPLLDVLQVIAHSSQSGMLTVEGESASGAVVFEGGGIVCVTSSCTETLLTKSASEQDADHGRTFRRVQTLAALAELLALREGVFRFRKSDEHVPELAKVTLAPFYTAGPMDTGDLLLVLATMVDRAPVASGPAPVPSTDAERAHPRYAPTVIPAALHSGRSRLTGHLTNLSAGGAFFHGESLPAVDSNWSLFFELPGVSASIETSVRVAWSRPDSSERIKGVGLTFDRISANDEALLAKYLSRFQALADEYRAVTSPR
jgi:Tfp pilus assembly protein PilZ